MLRNYTLFSKGEILTHPDPAQLTKPFPLTLPVKPRASNFKSPRPMRIKAETQPVLLEVLQLPHSSRLTAQCAVDKAVRGVLTQHLQGPGQ